MSRHHDPAACEAITKRLQEIIGDTGNRAQAAEAALGVERAASQHARALLDEMVCAALDGDTDALEAAVHTAGEWLRATAPAAPEVTP